MDAKALSRQGAPPRRRKFAPPRVAPLPTRGPDPRSAGSLLVRHGWLLIAAAVALVAVLATTRSGLGASTDSVAYVAQARSLRESRTLQVPTGIYEVYEEVDTARDWVAGPHFPPLFPAVLALIGASDNPTSSGRGLNASLLAATVLAVAFMVQRHTGWRGTALLAAGLVALSPAVLGTHAMLWSEPLFIALGLLGLLGLARYLEQESLPTLVAASVAIALAWLTRYAGIALVLTGLLVLVLSGPRPRGRRAALFLVLTSVPMLAFLLTMAVAGNSGGGYTLAPQAPSVSVLRQGGETLTAWALPSGIPALPGLFAWLAAVGMVSVVLARSARTSPRKPATNLSALRLPLSAFLLLYAAVLLGAIVMFAEHVPPEERMLVPAYVVAVALVACMFGRGLTERRLARGAVLFALAGLIVATAGAGSVLMSRGAADNRGFTSPVWAYANDVGQLSSLPASARIYSNFPEAVYLAAGRPARLLPKLELTDGRANPRYGAQLARLADDVRDGRSAVVFFTIGTRPQLPDQQALTTALGMTPTGADVVSYHWVTTR
ncbi:MAG: glycosyltransferase family 39 protein [Actinomycetota bacterium]|nr:glycosyltransferase family 39 protein [Actinomycetota bacterium]